MGEVTRHHRAKREEIREDWLSRGHSGGVLLVCQEPQYFQVLEQDGFTATRNHAIRVEA